VVNEIAQRPDSIRGQYGGHQMIDIATKFGEPAHDELRPRIAVIGVGGAGGNAIASMIRAGVQGVEFIAANTDAQSLRASPADRILQLGRATTQGLGAGSRAELGKAAAEESIEEIGRMLDGAHMCFIAAGMGGGTGTGAAPVIAKAAREKGILTVGVVTKPFAFEGAKRARAAEAGLEALTEHVDTLIVIPNQNLFRIASPGTTFKAAFDMADEVLQEGVRGITDLMVMPGFINLDFADIRTIMAGMGRAMMGTGEASGDDRALRAAEMAIANPLLDEAIKGAKGLIVSIIGGEDMRLMEVDEAASHIKELVDPDADIIWGSAFNPALEGRMRVSVIATGIGDAGAVAIESPLTRPAPEALFKAASAAKPAAAPAITAAIVPQREAIQMPLTLDEPEPVRRPLEAMIAAAARFGPREPGFAAPLGEAPPAPRKIELIPPSPEAIRAAEAAAAIATYENSHPEDGQFWRTPATVEPFGTLRGPSLFERMAEAAMGAVRRGQEVAPLAHLNHGPVFLDRRAAA
jgi:cell division protein FtsZ